MKSYVSPSALLSAGAAQYRADATGRGSARDLSQPVYTPWRNFTDGGGSTSVVLPAEFLQALPKVKGSPLEVIPSDGEAAATQLRVRVQRDIKWSATASSLIYTDVGTDISLMPTVLLTPFESVLARIGLRISALKIDSAVAPALSRDPSAWRVPSAANRLLQSLDAMIGQGVAGAFDGLKDLADGAGRFVDATGLSLEQVAANLLTKISTTGRGCGEGVHCLVGNDTVLTALMQTATAKNNATCGWRHDPRTGLVVYHYLGIPYYRCNIVTDELEGEYLFAANLGPTGLALVHAYGTAETYGLEVEQEPTAPHTASRDIIVHGAYALLLWDPGAIYGYKKVPLT